MIRCLTILAASLAAIFAQAAFAETRALIIGSNYETAVEPDLKLTNPIADARMVSAALRRTAVNDVTLVEEPDAEAWDESFNEFAAGLQDGDIAILYFAGHGFQIDGANYLMASDGTALVSLASLLDRLSHRTKGVVVIIDACRDNPLSRPANFAIPTIVEITDLSRGLKTVTLQQLSEAGTGLSQLSTLRGQSALVFFSTEPGNVAEDGALPGMGSLFARAFADEITQRKSLEEVFRSVAARVYHETDGRQAPWRQGDLHFGVYIAGMRSLPIP